MRRLGAVTSGELEILTESTDAGTRIAVRGELDVATVAELRSALDTALDAGGRTVLVLAECTFLDSSALKTIADASRRAREAGLGLALAQPSPQVARVLEISGLEDVVTIQANDYP